MQNVIIVQINYGKYSDCLEMKTFLILSWFQFFDSKETLQQFKVLARQSILHASKLCKHSLAIKRKMVAVNCNVTFF